MNAPLTTPNPATELWDRVSKTDPKHTKTIEGKPYKGTSPSPYWLVRMATETFGPIGIGWGFDVKEQNCFDGAPGDRVHVATVRLWYIWKGQRGEFEHVGGTMLAGKNRNGPYSDEDAAKKSVTDALVKALSLIGFAGDIFSGLYDDSKYVAHIRQEFREPPKPPAPPKLDGSVWLKFKLALSAAATESELNKHYVNFVRKYDPRADDLEEANALMREAGKRFWAAVDP